MSLMASEDAGEWIYVGSPFDPFEVDTVSTAILTQGSAALGTWYNLTGLNLVIPAGKWRVSYTVLQDASFSTDTANYQISSTLSETNNGETDSSMTSVFILQYTSYGVKRAFETQQQEGILTLSASDTYYLNLKVDGVGTPGNLSAYGTLSDTRITAKRVF